MHTDLSPHLHTPECRAFIEQLKECHQNVSSENCICMSMLDNLNNNLIIFVQQTIWPQNKFAKFLGVCNDIDRLVVSCCKTERQSRQAANYKKSVEKRDAIKERLKQSSTPNHNQS